MRRRCAEARLPCRDEEAGAGGDGGHAEHRHQLLREQLPAPPAADCNTFPIRISTTKITEPGPVESPDPGCNILGSRWGNVNGSSVLSRVTSLCYAMAWRAESKTKTDPTRKVPQREERTSALSGVGACSLKTSFVIGACKDITLQYHLQVTASIA